MALLTSYYKGLFIITLLVRHFHHLIYVKSGTNSQLKQCSYGEDRVLCNGQFKNALGKKLDCLISGILALSSTPPQTRLPYMFPQGRDRRAGRPGSPSWLLLGNLGLTSPSVRLIICQGAMTIARSGWARTVRLQEILVPCVLSWCSSTNAY